MTLRLVTTDSPRALSYRYHDTRPTAGIALTEYLIEDQLNAAHITGAPLVTFSPMLGDQHADATETLLDLADEVRAAENRSRTEYHACIDDYATALRTLALAVRGAVAS
jgi:hypothetical protein